MAKKGKVVKGTSGRDVLKGAAGNDTLYGYAGNDKLLGAAGNDNLLGGAGNDTLTGGAGKDTFTYANGEGKDTITDYKAGQDTLYISRGAISKTSLSGKNLVFTVGKGSITLKNAATQAISLKDSRGNYTMTKTALTLTSNFGGTMDAAKYLSTVRTIDGSKTKKAVNLTGNSAANTLKGGSGKNTLKGGAGNDSLYGYAGNDVLNGGVGNDYLDGGKGSDALTGGAGNDIFVYRDGDGVDTINDYEQGKDTLYLAKGAFKSTTISSNSLVFNVGSGKVTMKNAAAKTITLKNADGGIYTMTKTALTAKSGFGGTMNAAAHLSTITDVNGAAATKASVLYGNSQANTITGGSANDKLYGNAGNDKLNGGKGNDYLDGGAGNDYLSGDAGNDTLYGGAGVDTFAYADGAGRDTISDYTAGDLLHITSGAIAKTALSGSNVVFTVGSGSVTLTGAAARTISLKDSRGSYTMNNTALTLSSDFGGTMDATKYLSTITTIDGSKATKALNLSGNAQANTITGGSANDKLYGNAGNDKLNGGKGNDYLDGGAGNDMLTGGAGNDTLMGGTGIDTFVYAANEGTDIVNDYTEGELLHISSGTISKATLSNNNADMAFTVGSGTIILKNAGTKTVSLKDSQGSYTMSKNMLTLGADFGGTVNLSQYLSTIKNVNGSAVTKTVNIYGNSNANTLYAGKAGGTLRGYDGNDTLYGGAGADVFQYDSGNDVIYNYDAGKDLIRLTSGYINSAEVSGDDCVLNISNGKTITLKGVGYKKISYMDSNSDRIYWIQAVDLELYGTDGDDTLLGGTHRDYLNGHAGNDSLVGGAGNDNLEGESGNDTLFGGEGDDVLYGGEGDDFLDGGEGDDTLYADSSGGNDGNDTIVCERGNDVIESFDFGTDTIWFKSTTLQSAKTDVYDNAVLTLANGATIRIDYGFGKQVSYVDSSGVKKTITIDPTLYGTDEDDSLVGTDDGVRMDGLGGNDTITGGAGDDRLISGSGNNVLYGEAGNDYLVGGFGANSLYGGSGDDTIRAGLVEGVYYFDGGENLLDGGSGNDSLVGSVGDDTLYGGSGNDSLEGDSGDDILYGGTGNDYLDGGGENDTLYGGIGNDTYKGGNGNDEFYHEAGNDVINDYSANDTIHFEATTLSRISVEGSREGNIKLSLADGGSITLLFSIDPYIDIATASMDIAYVDSSGQKKYKKVTWSAGEPIIDIAWPDEPDGMSGMMASSSSCMIPNSTPIFGADAAQLSSLVSMTQTGNLGALSGTSTGLASDNAADGRLVVANGTAATNPLTNQRTA